MLGELIAISEAGPELLAQWQALSARSVEPNPWFEPHVVLSLATIRTDLFLLVARRESRLHACIVVAAASRSWHGIKLPMWQTPNPMGTPLVDVEGGELALEAVFDSVSKSRGARFLLLQGLAADGPIAGMTTRAFKGGWKYRTVRSESAWPILRRRPEPTYLEVGLNAKHRYNAGRLRRRLEQHLGSELRLFERSSEGEAIERFLALEASGWKGRRGTALACDPLWTNYFRRVCRGFADEGRLRLYSLESGPTTVAMKVMIRAGDGAVDFRVAYDERFARFSPGVLLEVEALEEFHNGDRAWLLSNTNHSTSPLLRVWPERCATLEVLAECPGAARQAFRSLMGATA